MSPRSTAARLAVVAAAAALSALAVGTPAHAANGDNDADEAYGTYQGRVTARTGLLLRDSPTRGGRVLRSEPYGAIVSIFCKTAGDRVDGNNRWYLLTDGTWAWGSARYIDNIGKAPRWC
ncbi:SH3 domain-containing protein [Streptomyces himalayensis]|uniref:SH3 domain-containing protein n=1 Tax=Streptomyces himalayensis subsp. himalayensis TaxID=2756131 RepID=A0A7W0DG79_9ACTN|nr:SH3 domain-containing protein [Streptomyces himalayensis subsp. himalayensis]